MFPTVFVRCSLDRMLRTRRDCDGQDNNQGPSTLTNFRDLKEWSAAGIADRLGAVAIFAFATIWLLSSLVAIANFSLRYPAFDQYHFYPKYLSMAFPGSAFQLENGHRTVLPTLVRLAEIEWLQANQSLQMFVGVLAVLTILATIAIISWRDRVSRIQAATAVLISVLGISWLGNARMLVHGNEILHVYFVIAFAVLALSCVYAAKRMHPLRWIIAAGLLCVCATLSFGAGISSFAAALFMALLIRLPLRPLTTLVLMLAGTITLYLIGMPGDEGVRGTLLIQPLENATVGLRWLSAPWMHAWFGMANPPLMSWLPSSARETPIVGNLLADSAQALATFFDEGWLVKESLAVGAIGALAWIAMVVNAWRQREGLSRSRFLALGMATLGLCVGAIICLTRVEHFEASPGDVLAERYLPWSCVFWMGLAWYPVASLRKGMHARTAVLAAIAMTATLALLPTQRSWAGWAAAVHRNIEQSAVAAQLGIWDAQRFPDGADASKADVLATLGLLREQHLSMFGEPEYALWRDQWNASLNDAAMTADAFVRITREFADDRGRAIAVFEGSTPRIVNRPRDAIIVVVDASGNLRGLAKFSFLGFDKKVLRFNLPQSRGFDGYVVEPTHGEELLILILNPRTNEIFARFPLKT